MNSIKPGTDGCLGPDNCIRVISGVGTPALWWIAVFALVAAAILWMGGRDWRFGIPVVGVLSSWLPWFAFQSRPLFFFYAISIIPFSVMAIALCAGWILGDARPATAVWSARSSSEHSLLWWPPTLPISIRSSATNFALSQVAVAHVVQTWI